MSQSIEELEKIAEQVLASLGSTPQLSALFKYLWAHQETRVRSRDIWEESRLKVLCRSPHKNENSFKFPAVVRQAALDLRARMHAYFRKHPKESWRIELPDAEGRGYQLESVRIANEFKVTGAFWEPHLQGERPVSVIYVQQTFYYDRKNRLVFRYYDCNREHGKDALPELHKNHGDRHQDTNESLRPIYPYIAKGDAEALHLIRKWFGKYAAVQVQPVTTRNYRSDDFPDDDSVILFGSAPSNRFTRHLLERHQDVPIVLEDRTRVRLLSPTSAERQRIAGLEKDGYCRLREMDDSCIIDFADDKSWPGILTRLPNHYTSRTPTTIFDSAFGTAVLAIADLLTDEHRLPRGLQALNISLPFIDYFQFLYCVDAVRHDTKPRILPIAWRPYQEKGI